MTKEYYTNVASQYGKIFYRGYSVDENGVKKRRHVKVPFAPTLYLKCDDTESKYKSLYGEPLQAKQFSSMPEARAFVKDYSDVMDIYGYEPNRFEYNFLATTFRDILEIGVDEVSIGSVDIETTSEHGKIDTINVPEEITLITYQNIGTKKLVTFGARPSTVENYVLCKDEKDVISKFIAHVIEEDPDIITGWHIAGFDIPYIVNRSNKLLGEATTNKLSPFGIIDMRVETVQGKEKQKFTIVGRTVLDMLDLYLKFTFVKRENYKLDTVAKAELGAGKLEHPYKTFREFYEKDWDKFVEYNQIDTIRVSELEDKLGLIALAMAMAYRAKINYADVYGPVKIWECMILSRLLNSDTFASIKRSHKSSAGIVGAYVHNPIPGFYDWVVSIDAEALYPSIDIGLNMSPETFVGMNPECSEEALLAGFDFHDNENNYTIAANGAMFTKEKQGVIPALMQSLKDGRNVAKKEMLAAKQAYIDTGDEKYKKISVLKGTSQLALKILNNSGYGAMSNSGFLFFDNRLAEGITMTGRYIIQYVSHHFNKRLNDFFKTTNVNYIVYMDTDSSMFTLGTVIRKHYKEYDDFKITEILDKLVENHLREFINEATNTIAKHQNYYTPTIFFKREKICSAGFWVAPKKYALKVYDNEGVRYAEPDFAITGIEVVRSSTPAMVREALRNCVQLIINNKIDELRVLTEKTHSDFMTANIEEIAFPKGVNNLIKYSSDENIYGNGCPMHVRAALLHNHYLDKFGLENDYQPIEDGDRIKYVYLEEPNPFKENVIGFFDKLPIEFKLDKYVNRELQFQKTFLDPLNGIMKAVGWKLEEETTLEDFWN